MGQKINPIGLRLQVNRTWDSRWFADTKEYGNLLHEDLRDPRLHPEERGAGRRQPVMIERPHRKCRVTIHCRPSGRHHRQEGRRHRGAAQEAGADHQVRAAPQHRRGAQARDSTRRWWPRIIAQQLERRVSFRRAMKRAVQNAMRMGALGIRINVAGRLGGAEIARTEWYREGRVPLHTLRADIDYALPRRRPPTASSGSRSGSSKARSWSTTRRRATAASRSCRTDAAPRGAGGGGGGRRDRDRDR